MKFKDGVRDIDAYAKHPWNWTGIYLEKGKPNKFRAKGMWNSGSVVAGPLQNGIGS